MSNTEALSFATTIRVRDACLCLHLQRAARALARHFDNAFRPLGLTSGQFSLMMSLNRPESPTIGSVASLLAMDRTTLTAALKPLQRRGLVRVTIDAADRRSRRLALTETGRDLLDCAVPVWEREHDAVEYRLGQDGADRMRAGLLVLSEPAGTITAPDNGLIQGSFVPM
jgi:DNA-binding MarR family transcriptional regulator